MDFLQIIVWTAAGFLLGAIPFSVILTRAFGATDPRSLDDGNPGAMNAWQAGGWKAGVPTLLLDFFKGAVPVGMAFYWAGISGYGMLPVALAPIVGHAYSPFLRFRGGKALAVTFGVWAGLSFGEAALILGLLCGLFFFTIRPRGWAAMLGMLGLLLYLSMGDAPSPVIAIWAGNTLVIWWKHRPELSRLPELHPELVANLQRILRR